MLVCYSTWPWLASCVQLCSEYIGVMSKILSGHFRTYLVALEKMVSPVAGPADVLGVPESPSSGVAGVASGVASGVGSMMSLFTKAGGRAANTVSQLRLTGLLLSCIRQHQH